jgi:hypothetical protein
MVPYVRLKQNSGSAIAPPPIFIGRMIFAKPLKPCLEHDPEKWIPVFPRDKREAFARRSCSIKKDRAG